MGRRGVIREYCYYEKSFKFDNPVAQNLVKSLAEGNSSFDLKGIKSLFEACEKNILPGYIIFGTSTFAHATGKDDNPSKANMVNSIGAKNFRRNFAYFHVAIYAGMPKQCHGCELFYQMQRRLQESKCPRCDSPVFTETPYVIENGGHEEDTDGIGMVSAKPLEEAFMSDAEFIVFSPPGSKSLLFNQCNLIMHRALACLGLYYHYDMAAVSCEVFATSIIRLTPQFEPIQLEVLKAPFGQVNVENYDRFYNDLMKRLKKIDSSHTLTLVYYLNSKIQGEMISELKNAVKDGKDAFELNDNIDPWFQQTMFKDYDTYQRTKDPALIHKGLAPKILQFGYHWLNLDDEDAPGQLQIHFDDEKYADVKNIILNAILALYLKYKEIFFVLYHKGKELNADWNTKNEFGGTVLMIACYRGYDDIVSMLLKNPEIDVNACDNFGHTALHIVLWSTLHFHPKVFSLLWQDSRTNFNIKSIKGITPFILACRLCNTEVIKQFLDNHNRIDLTIKDYYGYNCFMAAIAKGRSYCWKTGTTTVCTQI